jgi:hypothetical protein
MVAALLIRRKQLLLRGLEDTFPAATGSGFATVRRPGCKGFHTDAFQPVPGNPQAVQLLEQATHQQALNKSLLKLTRVLDRSESPS